MKKQGAAKNIYKNFAVISIAAAVFMGCARAPEREQPEDNNLDFGVETSDMDVTVLADKKVPLQSPKGLVPTADLFAHIYLMQRLGEKTKNTTWAADSQEQFLNLYRTEKTYTKTDFRDSPYVEFMIANSKPMYLEATRDLDQIFVTQMGIISDVLNQIKDEYLFPEKDLTVSQALKESIDLISLFEAKIGKSNLIPGVKQSILAGIYEQFWLKMPAAEQILIQFEQAPDFTSAIAILKGLFTTFNFEVDQDVQGKLESASEVAKLLNKEKLSAKDAFIILVVLWDKMNAEERKETFGEVAPELYEFLDAKNKKERECLKNKTCNDLLLDIARKFFILPEIKKYGVAKLQKEIDESAKASIREETGAAATQLIRDMPGILQQSISDEFSKSLTQLKGYREDYDGFVKGELQRWYTKKFLRTSLPALEGRQILINYDQSGLPSLTSPYVERDVEVSADALANALLASHQLFKKPRAKSLKYDLQPAQIMSLVRVNQLLAHGGFSTADGKSFSALSRGFNLKELVPLNIQKSLELPYLFSMPGPQAVAKGFEISDTAIPKDFLITTQAKLLVGFTRMTEVFKDWTKAPLDDLLGDIEAGEMIESLPAEDLAVPAFPKDAFLAIALGNASSVMANLTANGTPLFVLCVDGIVVWADQDEVCHKPSALAGLVNVKSRTRENRIITVEQAQFLSAVIQYLNMGQELIENTKSQHLLASKDGQKSALEEFKEALPRVRDLAVGLTNLLISKTQTSDGHFFTHYDFQAINPLKSAEFVTSQEHILILRALLDSADYFKIPPYKRAVIRAYHGLNNGYYNQLLQFYEKKLTLMKEQVTAQAPVSTIEMAQAISTVSRMDNYLKEQKSIKQLRNMIDVWRDSLRGRKL